MHAWLGLEYIRPVQDLIVSRNISMTSHTSTILNMHMVGRMRNESSCVYMSGHVSVFLRLIGVNMTGHLCRRARWYGKQH